jgi:hypothetical protein
MQVVMLHKEPPETYHNCRGTLPLITHARKKGKRLSFLALLFAAGYGIRRCANKFDNQYLLGKEI